MKTEGFTKIVTVFGATLLSATLSQAQSIVGNVSTTFGVPIPGVLVLASRTGQSVSDTTDAAGNYSIATGFHLTPTAYNVEPIKAGYTFTPAFSNVTVHFPDNSTANFTAPGTVPSTTTGSAGTVTPTSATLSGTVNPDGAATTAWFEYGLTTSYGSVSSSTSIGNGILAVPVNIGVSGLLNGTNYHFRIAASNHFGLSPGSDSIFSTPSGIPLITTLPPSSSGARAMSLHGLAFLQGATASVWFEWGLTTNYGNLTMSSTVSDPTSPIEFSQVVTGLVTATTYHYRAVGGNSLGTAYGTDAIFTPVFNDALVGLPGVFHGSVATGDFDNDGHMDILLTGTTNSSAAKPVTQVWRNTDSGFTNINAKLPGVYLSSVALGDYDNDGRLDILLTGTTNASATGAVAQVWRNTSGGFTNINAGLPGVYQSSVAWGDYDNDGLPDILLTGTTNGSASGALAQVWRNTGSGFTSINAGLPGVYQSSVAWGDYDNDGQLDILLTGQDTTGTLIAQVWRNTGSGFTNINAALPGVYEGSGAWGDYDNDGRLDILLSGYSTTGAVTQVWRNTGNGFTNIDAGLPAVYEGSVAWGDFDKDGRLDILLTGSGLAQVWRNTGSGFIEVDSGLPELEGSSATWFDYDNDGYPDILLTGGSRNPFLPPPPPPTPLTQVWHNNYVALRLDVSGRALTNGQFHFFLTGLPGASYITRASLDLTAWTPISTNTLSTSRVEIIDTSAGTDPRRFYRAEQSAP